MSEDLADRIEALDVVEVTQADREAAADVWRDYIARIGEVMAEKAIRKGISDDTIIVQAFARHRITALRLAETSAALPDDVAGLVELLEAAEAVLMEHHGGLKAADPRTPAIFPVWQIIRKALAVLHGGAS